MTLLYILFIFCGLNPACFLVLRMCETPIQTETLDGDIMTFL